MIDFDNVIFVLVCIWQEEKRNMVASAFGEDHAGGSGARLTVDDLKYLFMVQILVTIVFQIIIGMDDGSTSNFAFDGSAWSHEGVWLFFVGW